MPEWRDEIRRRLAPLRLPSDREASVAEELSQHLEDHYRELMADGLSEIDARERALAGLDRHELIRELRYAVRMLRRAPGFAAVTILTLALGIGANTAVFTIVNAVLLRPLPYREPTQIVKIWGRYDKLAIAQNWISEPEWWDMRDTLRSFSAMAAYSTGGGANLTRNGHDPLRVTTTSASADLFPLLGVSPMLGRVFLGDEDQPGRNHVAVLDFGFWTSQMAADPAVIGRSVQLNGEPYTIVGVWPKEFQFGGPTDLWVPLALDRAKPADRGSHYLEVVGRLRPGISLAQAGADLDALVARMAAQFPRNYTGNGFGMFVRPLREELVGNVRLAMMVVFAAVGFVLLIACINLANLMLARSSSRTREMAVRTALGAARLRLVGQLLTESLVISLLGGACGVLLAIWSTRIFSTFTAAILPTVTPVAVDGRVLAYAAGLSILTGILFGVAPAVQLSSWRIGDVLKDAARESSAATGRTLRAGLVVAEIAIAVVLLVAAGLMVRSLQHLLEVRPGFQPEHLLTARISLPDVTYQETDTTNAFYRAIADRARALPGVQSVGLTSLLPMTGQNSSGSTFVEHTSVGGLPIFDLFRAPYIEADQRSVTAGLFEAMKIPLIRGRLFTADDDAHTPPVAIVDQEFARRFWPDRDPIGERIATGAIPKSDPPVPLWRTVVGVVGHVKNSSLDQAGREQVYLPIEQRGFRIGSMYLTIRAAGDPALLASAVQREVHALDPALPLYDVKTMDEWLGASVALRRFNTWLLAGFAALALALAAIGTYGVVAYSVSQRTQEIGIRVALGATRRDVLRMILIGGLRLAAIGVVVGALLAAVAGRLLSTLLFDVGSTDPIAFGITIAVLLGAALAASYIPARRATRIDPLAALRCE